jgi:chromosome segregation ATPase
MGEGLIPLVNAEAVSPGESIRPIASSESGWQTTQLEFTWLSSDSERLGLSSQGLPIEPTAEVDQSRRIQQMEQALDQCQIYINELKQQLADQEFLEAVLAQTEEAAHIQQQAINSLRKQLCQQNQLEQQILELEQSKQDLQATCIQISTLNETLQTERQDLLAHLQEQQVEAAATLAAFKQKFADLGLRYQAKETESQSLQLLANQQSDQIARLHSQVAYLQTEVSDRQYQLNTLESRIQRTKEVIAAQQDIISALQQNQGTESSKNKVIQGMSKTLLNAQTKMEALEAEFSNQRLLHAQLQHYSQEVEQKANEQQKRATQLETQVAEMQEQILQQAQQSREHETAIQHWKDRCHTAEQSVLQFKIILEQIVTERNLGDLCLPGSPSLRVESTVDGLAPEELPPEIKFDLPEFLYLRRNK